ncbi:MAG: cytochrome b/b6 domain-containing protein [Azonexus sp.]|nr:cytochrome b/b6 domain-containing protein [Azonexus sp.]
MNSARYTFPAVLLHWLMAGLVLYMLWLGVTMVDLPKGPDRTAAYGLHKSFGLLLLGLFFVRFGWRLRHAPPPLSGTGWERKVAHATHHALYLFLLLTPLAGYLASSFSTYPLKFFGLDVIKLGWPDEGIQGGFKLIHLYSAWIGMLLVGLHFAGAIKNALRRDGSLQRMLPCRCVQKLNTCTDVEQ